MYLKYSYTIANSIRVEPKSLHEVFLYYSKDLQIRVVKILAKCNFICAILFITAIAHAVMK